jgi:hypothetical protein
MRADPSPAPAVSIRRVATGFVVGVLVLVFATFAVAIGRGLHDRSEAHGRIAAAADVVVRTLTDSGVQPEVSGPKRGLACIGGFDESCNQQVISYQPTRTVTEDAAALHQAMADAGYATDSYTIAHGVHL